jgi:hypothetical protein
LLKKYLRSIPCVKIFSLLPAIFLFLILWNQSFYHFYLIVVELIFISFLFSLVYLFLTWLWKNLLGEQPSCNFKAVAPFASIFLLIVFSFFSFYSLQIKDINVKINSFKNGIIKTDKFSLKHHISNVKENALFKFSLETRKCYWKSIIVEEKVYYLLEHICKGPYKLNEKVYIKNGFIFIENNKIKLSESELNKIAIEYLAGHREFNFKYLQENILLNHYYKIDNVYYKKLDVNYYEIFLDNYSFKKKFDSLSSFYKYIFILKYSGEFNYVTKHIKFTDTCLINSDNNDLPYKIVKDRHYYKYYYNENKFKKIDKFEFLNIVKDFAIKGLI